MANEPKSRPDLSFGPNPTTGFKFFPWCYFASYNGSSLSPWLKKNKFIEIAFMYKLHILKMYTLVWRVWPMFPFGRPWPPSRFVISTLLNCCSTLFCKPSILLLPVLCSSGNHWSIQLSPLAFAGSYLYVVHINSYRHIDKHKKKWERDRSS